MRHLLILLSLCVLVGCSSIPVESSQVSKNFRGEDPLYLDDLEQVLTKKSNQSSYGYTVKMKLQNQETIWQGNQTNEDWTLTSSKPTPVTVSKKGKQVSFQLNGKTENLTVEQTGVISPLDHFRLVQEIKKEVKLISTEVKQGNTWVQLKVSIDEGLLAQKIKKRLLKSSNDYPFIPEISDQIKVSYQVTYIQETKELAELSMQIESKTDHKEEIVYRFGE
ncbi:hypothetical protein [Hazenella coriacea]|uniref:Outer membrane lipoprotein-sorting protein n=1 Tax=Hazenella coriacea TaxID=1179467 RepID=A0A4R3L574_9BACL|nr:hypothetical protein [Hazenella coriacea]TCS93940.1 hypothetical protein EDD58_105151 [Hazenella coriacea]